MSVIHLQVGQLRQVVPDTLRFCWSLVSDETNLAGTTLGVDSVQVSLRCLDCEGAGAVTE